MSDDKYTFQARVEKNDNDEKVTTEEISPQEILTEDFITDARKLIATGVEWHHVMGALSNASDAILEEYAPSREIAVQVREISIKADIQRYVLSKDHAENYDEKVNEEFFRLLEEQGYIDKDNMQ